MISIPVYRNGCTVARTPVTTDVDNKPHLNTLEALVFEKPSHDVPFSTITKRPILVLALSIYQQLSCVFYTQNEQTHPLPSSHSSCNKWQKTLIYFSSAKKSPLLLPIQHVERHKTFSRI